MSINSIRNPAIIRYGQEENRRSKRNESEKNSKAEMLGSFSMYKEKMSCLQIKESQVLAVFRDPLPE